MSQEKTHLIRKKGISFNESELLVSGSNKSVISKRASKKAAFVAWGRCDHFAERNP